VVTESKTAGPLKREGTVLSSVKWSVSVWRWERETSRYPTYGHKPLMRKDTPASQDGPFRSRKRK